MTSIRINKVTPETKTQVLDLLKDLPVTFRQSSCPKTSGFGMFYINPRKNAPEETLYKAAELLKEAGYRIHPIWEDSIKLRTLHIGCQASLSVLNTVKKT